MDDWESGVISLVHLERGIDISRVRKMVEHASVDTTARYDRRPEMEPRKAVEVLHCP